MNQRLLDLAFLGAYAACSVLAGRTRAGTQALRGGLSHPWCSLAFLIFALPAVGCVGVGEVSQLPSVSETETDRALATIAALNDDLAAIITVNPQARARAAQLAGSDPVGLLHAVPVVVKDNIATADMATSAGSLALEGVFAVRDAEVVRRLRNAGAVIVGKSNMSEWANFRGRRSVSGWSAVGGQTRNPYDFTQSPCGSSSGSAVAVASGMVSMALGTETNGSIVCPAAMNGIVGLKPTVGRVPAEGVVPLAPSQDSVGPMGATVADVARLFAVLVDEGPNEELVDLRGLRVGLPRNLMGYDPAVDERFATVVDMLNAEGIDSREIEIPEFDPEAGLDILFYEFRETLPAYLAEYQPAASVKDLSDVVAVNRANADRELDRFGQELLLEALAREGRDGPRYRAAMEEKGDFIRAMTEAFEPFDILLAPATSRPWPVEQGDAYLGSASGSAAVAGFPVLSLPMGLVDDMPAGLAILGAPNSEWRLLAIARVLESLLPPTPKPTHCL